MYAVQVRNYGFLKRFPNDIPASVKVKHLTKAFRNRFLGGRILLDRRINPLLLKKMIPTGQDCTGIWTRSEDAKKQFVRIGAGAGHGRMVSSTGMTIFTLPLSALIITIVLHLIALRDFPKIGLLDFPERYGLKRGRLPYPTGIIAVLVFLGCFAFLAPWTEQSAGIFLGVLLIALASFMDDRKRLPAWVRLLVQAVAALLIFATDTRIYTLTDPFFGQGFIKLDTINIPTHLFGPLPLWSGVFTLFWLMLTMNALNWFDGIPGQVSVLSVIGFVVIGGLAMSARVHQPDLAAVSFVLAAIALGGLLFDFPPNRVLMGDTGAMFFGLMLGVLTIYAGGKVATVFLVLGVPLIDLFIVVLRRIAKGESPMRGNAVDEHLHHRLLRKGWSPRQIIVLTATIGTIFGICALFLSTIGKFAAAAILFLLMLVLSMYSKPRTPGRVR